jgi:hypothetical protein
MTNKAQTLSLFDEPAGADTSLIEVLSLSKPASKAQQTFRRLIAQLETRREHLQRWQAYAYRYNERMAAEFSPLEAELLAGQRKMVLLLDELLSQPAGRAGLRRLERAKLCQMLLNLASDLLDDGPDAELEALHDKYSKVSHAQARQSEIDVTQAMLEDVFGCDIGAGGSAASVDELLEKAQHEMRQRVADGARRAEEERQAGQPRGGAKAGSAKAAAAQARREKAASEVGQSVREVYRKLASALHPDREPDAAARQRKTAMMQRVNQAYDARDLLTLLGLQLEIEQIDAQHLANVPAARLAHYNQVLREQLLELGTEIERCVHPFRHALGWARAHAVVPETVDRRLSADIARMRAGLRELEEDLAGFRDPAYLRKALRDYVLEPEADDLDEMMEVMALFAPAHAPKRRKRRR